MLLFPCDARNFKEAVEECNNTHYGLQSGVFTSDLNKAFYAFENMEVSHLSFHQSDQNVLKHIAFSTCGKHFRATLIIPISAFYYLELRSAVTSS